MFACVYARDKSTLRQSCRGVFLQLALIAVLLADCEGSSCSSTPGVTVRPKGEISVRDTDSSSVELDKLLLFEAFICILLNTFVVLFVTASSWGNGPDLFYLKHEWKLKLRYIPKGLAI